MLFVIGMLSFVGTAVADDGNDAGNTYKVTVTSLLHGTPATNANSAGNSPESLAKNVLFGSACPNQKDQPAGPERAGEMLGLWFFATHNQNFSLFTLGQPARRELALLSQTGRPFALRDSLAGNKDVGAFTVPASFPPPNGPSGIVLCPGESLTVTVSAPGNHKYLSLAGMIFPTNDGFVAVNGVPLPDGNNVLEVYSPAYDSGSEENDEACPNIPSLIFAGFPFPAKNLATGTACPNGLGTDNDVNSSLDPASPDNNPFRAEGSVHIHPGIKGVGDLDPNVWNWENPVAKITISKVN
jgi:hypothetical protein